MSLSSDVLTLKGPEQVVERANKLAAAMISESQVHLDQVQKRHDDVLRIADAIRAAGLKRAAELEAHMLESARKYDRLMEIGDRAVKDFETIVNGHREYVQGSG